MKKVIFILKDEQLNIIKISKLWKKVSLGLEKTIYNANMEEVINQNLYMLHQKKSEEIDSFLSENKLKGKKADFIIALDSIITRTIEIPYLNKNKLKQYLNKNIINLFTVNVDEYFYDYKVVGLISKTKDSKKKLKIKIVIVPLNVITGIKKLTETLGIKLNKISIYPDIMQQMVNTKDDVCVLDSGNDKSIISIFEQGSTFLYASFLSSLEDFDGAIDEIEYFTDFYASRHQGKSLDYFHLIGKQATDTQFAEQLTNRTGISVYKTTKNKFLNPLVRFSQQKQHTMYNKYIDFSNEEALNKKQKIDLRPLFFLMVLIIITATWYNGTNYYLKQQETKYTFDSSSSGAYMTIQDEIDVLLNTKAIMIEKKEAVKTIASTTFDHMEIMEVLLTSIPNQVTISNINMRQETIDINFNINHDTTDVLELIIALNNTEYFKTIDITELELDDKVESVTLVLEVIQLPDKSEDEEVIE